jgi:phenylacetate-CoA ligase
MGLTYERDRLGNFAAALRGARELRERERWPRERLREHQRERLAALVRHAVEHAPYWRERLGGIDGRGPVDLADLPVLGKQELLDRFDDLVTDRRLRREAVLAHVESVARDELYLDAYRVMTTSGSSGRKGVFVYDRDGWRAILGQFLRQSAMMGITPKLPRRRIATVLGASPAHMSRRMAESVRLGAHRVLSLAVTDPLDEIVGRLNRFRPEFLACYPSVAMRLADEQLAGRLRLSPSTMATSSELRTEEMTERLVAAFGVRPFDLYGTTEGLWGADCEHRAGIHLFEDLTIVENVDAEGRPVPDGQRGEKLLVTNLHNRVQPVIRMEVSDLVTLDPEPCPCGRTLVRLRAVEGRTDDVLRLPGRDGAPVAVQPLQFAVVTRDRDVREFQVVQQGDALRLLVVPRDGANGGLEERLGGVLGERLAALGVREPRVTVERRAELARTPGGKLQVIVADRGR